MRAGLLTEKIHILRPIVVPSGTGAQDTIYDSCIRCRAHVVKTSGNRTIENDEVVFPQAVTFQIRRFYDFDETYRIYWNRRQWRILSIFPRRTEQMIEI